MKKCSFFRVIRHMNKSLSSLPCQVSLYLSTPEILCKCMYVQSCSFLVLFKSGASISPRFHKTKPHCPSKPNALRAYLSGAGPQGWEGQNEARTSHSFGRTSSIVIILLFVGHPPSSMGLDYLVNSPPLIHFTVVLSLYLF